VSPCGDVRPKSVQLRMTASADFLIGCLPRYVIRHFKIYFILVSWDMTLSVHLGGCLPMLSDQIINFHCFN